MREQCFWRGAFLPVVLPGSKDYLVVLVLLVLLSSTQFYSVLLRSTQFYSVLLSSTQFSLALLSSTQFYLAPLSST